MKIIRKLLVLYIGISRAKDPSCHVDLVGERTMDAVLDISNGEFFYMILKIHICIYIYYYLIMNILKLKT